MSLLLGGCKKGFVIKDSIKTPSDTNSALFGRTSLRDGHFPASFQPPLENVWTYKATSAIGPSLLTVDGIVYLATKDGRIDAVDIATGTRLKRTKTVEQNEATCAYFDGDLYLAYRYGIKTLARLDLDTGKYLWRVDAGDIATEPLVTKDGVFIAALYEHVDKYDLSTGLKKWSFETDGQLRSSPALENGVLVVGCDSGRIYALDAETGKLKWKTRTNASVFATPVIANGRVFVGSTDSTFLAIELETGDIAWRFKTKSPIFQSAATDGDVVLVGGTDGNLYCFATRDGTQLWRFQAQGVISTAPVIANGTVYFGSLDTNYYAIAMTDGRELWRFTTRGRVRTSPVIWGDYLLGASENKYLFSFKARPADISYSK